MRAVVCRELKGLDGLELADIERPEPGPGEVRLRVRAAGLNFADTLIIRGQYQQRPEPPFVPGMEVAGQVETCGPGVAGFTPGDRMMATLPFGGFAEEAIVPASQLVRLPDAVDYVTAAGFAIAYGTAYGALVWIARLQAAETLVVHGAAGGVGLAAVECGRELGAMVIATARGPEHLEVAGAHGAHHVIDTGSEDVRERIKELTAGRGANVVFDPVGGGLFRASLRSIAWEGRILIIGFASGDIPQIPANLLLIKNVQAQGFHWGSYRERDPARVHAAFERLLGWYADGRIHPHVSDVLPLEEARAGLELLLGRRRAGKIVLAIDQDAQGAGHG
jgi:NADPH2:quinone reductase